MVGVVNVVGNGMCLLLLVASVRPRKELEDDEAGKRVVEVDRSSIWKIWRLWPGQVLFLEVYAQSAHRLLKWVTSENYGLLVSSMSQNFPA